MSERRVPRTGSVPGRERTAFASDQVPLYHQLATILRQKIASGDFAPGDQLPPESELVRSYGLSRMTVRQALSNLDAAGLVSRQAGRGTFVTAEAGLARHDRGLDASVDELIRMGEATEVELIDLAEIPARVTDARDLELEVGVPITRCKRLRRVQDRPYCYIENFMRVDVGRRLEAANWCHGSVLKFIEDTLDVALHVAKQQVRATLADASMAGFLETRIGSPVLEVLYLIHAQDGTPVERARLYYRSDFTFTLHLKRSSHDPDSPWSLEKHRLEV